LFCLTMSLSDRCSRQMESPHGNKMGSLNILEQFEHVNRDFCDLSIFIEILFVLFFKI
jgi:hypothetical protein